MYAYSKNRTALDRSCAKKLTPQDCRDGWGIKCNKGEPSWCAIEFESSAIKSNLNAIYRPDLKFSIPLVESSWCEIISGNGRPNIIVGCIY